MMECRIIEVEQGSDEWLDLRRKRITASCLKKVMAGKDTKTYKKYRAEKIQELLGNKNVEETPEWAQHGKANEPQAMAAYTWQNQVDIEHNVFLIHKEYDWLAASPDFLHLPGYPEGGEIKCRQLYNTYRKHVQTAELYKGLKTCIPACDRAQVQGAMWLTGFKFWWYVNHYIGSDLEGGTAHKTHRIAVPRDQDLIDKMEERCLEFMAECYREAGLK
jgi:hypothetical protein